MCCLFGIIDYEANLSHKTLHKIVSVLAKECEVRGADATGIAYINRGKLKVCKQPLAAHKFKFSLPKDCHVVMGHTRVTTKGSEKQNRNNHPFLGNAGGMSFALAHNGVIWNDEELRENRKLPSTAIETDSYVAVQLIEKKGRLDFANIRYMAEALEGSFTFTVLDNIGNLYIVKGDNPLYLLDFGRFYMYASTEEILHAAVTKLRLHKHISEQIGIVAGDIIKIAQGGYLKHSKFSTDKLFNYGWSDRFHYHQNAMADWEQWATIARYHGYSEDMLWMLFESGYDASDIEDMLYAQYSL